MLEVNKVYQGDCLYLMKDISDGSIDMILCDLPYGITNCSWDIVIPFEPLWEQYNRIIKDEGAIVLFGTEPFSSYLRISNIKNYKYDWIWNKVKPGSGVYAKYVPLKVTENICVFGKGKIKYFPQMEKIKRRIEKRTGNIGEAFGGTKQKKGPNIHDNHGLGFPKNLLTFSNADQKYRTHPTQKPTILFEYLIKTYTEKNDLVLDNCIGSGTTAVACINTGRRFIGIELEEKYVKIANDRITVARKRKSMELFPFNE